MKVMEKCHDDIKKSVFELDLYKNQVNQLADLTKNQERVISYLNKDPQICDAKVKSYQDDSISWYKWTNFQDFCSNHSKVFQETSNQFNFNKSWVDNSILPSCTFPANCCNIDCKSDDYEPLENLDSKEDISCYQES